MIDQTSWDGSGCPYEIFETKMRSDEEITGRPAPLGTWAEIGRPQHPASETIVAFALGDLQGRALDRVAAHVDNCPRCHTEFEAVREAVTEAFGPIPDRGNR